MVLSEFPQEINKEELVLYILSIFDSIKNSSAEVIGTPPKEPLLEDDDVGESRGYHGAVIEGEIRSGIAGREEVRAETAEEFGEEREEHERE